MIIPRLERIPEVYDVRLERAYLEEDARVYLKVEENDFRIAQEIRKMMDLFYPLVSCKRPQGAVIDLACGGGGFTRQLSKVFPDCSVIGIDISEQAIACAKKRYADIPNLEFRLGDGLSLSSYLETARLVTCLDSLHHFKDLGQVVGEISSTLQEGGLFFARDFNRAEMSAAFIMACRPYIKVMKEKGERGFLAYLERTGTLLDNSRAMITASVLSKLAAHTSLELKEELHKQGFAIKSLLAPDALFIMFAIKVCDERRLAICREAGL